MVVEGIDITIRIGRLDDSALIARSLFDARTIICGSPEYLAEFGIPKTPQDSRDHRCLTFSNLADPDHRVYRDDQGESRRIRITAVMSANSGDCLCDAASRGFDLVMQPTFIAHDAIRKRIPVPVLTAYSWPVTPAYAVNPPTRHLTYRVRAFIDYLADYFAGTPYRDEDCLEC